MCDLNNSYSSRHHLDYLSECSKDHLTRKGRLHLKVNVIGSDHKELDQNIDTVLKNAESDILTLIADHYRAQGNREANTLKQRIETLAAKLLDQERLQYNQEEDFTKRRAQIRTWEQETTRLKKHTSLHHERTHNSRKENPILKIVNAFSSPQQTVSGGVLNPQFQLT